jgi:hypothetical protein
MDTFLQLIKNPIFKESLMSMTIIEKFDFNLKLADMFEKSKMISEAMNFTEIGYSLLKNNPDIVQNKDRELQILNRLVHYTYKQNHFDKAIKYSKTLLDLNKKLSPESPIILHNLFTLMALFSEKS